MLFASADFKLLGLFQRCYQLEGAILSPIIAENSFYIYPQVLAVHLDLSQALIQELTLFLLTLDMHYWHSRSVSVITYTLDCLAQ